LSQAKRRPTLVLAALRGDDVILCQITSQARADEYSVPRFFKGRKVRVTTSQTVSKSTSK
jgi:hypothetical protein